MKACQGESELFQPLKASGQNIELLFDSGCKSESRNIVSFKCNSLVHFNVRRSFFSIKLQPIQIAILHNLHILKIYCQVFHIANQITNFKSLTRFCHTLYILKDCTFRYWICSRSSLKPLIVYHSTVRCGFSQLLMIYHSSNQLLLMLILLPFSMLMCEFCALLLLDSLSVCCTRFLDQSAGIFVSNSKMPHLHLILE